MNIGLFTSVFFNNIGNGFIDFGAEATIKAAMPKDASLVKLSQCANFSASMGQTFLLKEMPVINWLWTRVMQKYANKLHDKSYGAVSTLDVFSPLKIAKLDYLIIPGCVLTVPFFTIFGKLLQEKNIQGCKLIFLGASGNHYTENEVRVVSEWLDKLKPYAIMTRDSEAYRHFSRYSENVYNGIDNVFFVNKVDIPYTETIMTPYDVLNFDEPKHYDKCDELEKKLAGKNLIKTNHKPFPYSKVSSLTKKGIMVSDYPLDYLFLYKNVEVTYSDRVHACIPTLSFGNKAQLFSDSPRIALFENIGIEINEIKSHPISLDRDVLNNLQENQIKYLRDILV